MAVDPVCKMSVDETKTSLKYDFKGKTYYFCCEGCLNKFKSSPEKFIAV
jgi:Cu+-exporting ATPase